MTSEAARQLGQRARAERAVSGQARDPERAGRHHGRRHGQCPRIGERIEEAGLLGL